MSGEQFTSQEFSALTVDQIKLLKPDRVKLLKFSKQEIIDMDGDRLKALVSLPDGSKVIEEGWNFVSPTDEQLAAEQAQRVADKAAAEQIAIDAAKRANDAQLAAEAERLARKQIEDQAAEVRRQAIAAEDAELLKSDIRADRDVNGNITKLIQEYQVFDDQNRPIGRPTHLEARTWPELALKQREAHSQAARAFARVKSQKLTFQKKQEESKQNQDAELAQAMSDLNSTDPQKKFAAIRKIAASDPTAQQRERDAEQARQSYIFRTRHVSDFNACAANIQLLSNYIHDNELEWTADNLDMAFDALQAQLAPPVEVPRAAAPAPNPTPVPQTVPPVTPAVSVNPAPQAVPALPAVPVPTPTPVAQPAPVSTPVPVNPEPEPQRPAAFSGGLVPGETVSGARPLPSAMKLTKKEIANWSSERMRQAMNNPDEVRQMEALGIRVLKGTWEQIRDRQR